MSKEQFSLFGEEAFTSDPPPKPTLPTAPKKEAGAEQIAQLDRVHAMLNVLLDMDAGKEMIGVMLGMSETLTLEQYRYLCGPVSVHQNGWTDMVSTGSFHWLHKAIYKDRLEIVINELKTGKSDGLASPSEVLIAMYPATMAAPIHHDWFQVYEWSWVVTLTKHKYADGMPLKDDGTPYESLWEFLGEKYPTPFNRIKQDYHQIASDIRRRVVKHAAERGIKLDKKQQRERSAKDSTPSLFEGAS